MLKMLKFKIKKVAFLYNYTTRDQYFQTPKAVDYGGRLLTLRMSPHIHSP